MSKVIIEPADYVKDNDALRHVERIEGTTVYMKDGGFMGIDEIDRVYLESDVSGNNDYEHLISAFTGKPRYCF